jgi:hypothetical protein
MAEAHEYSRKDSMPRPYKSPIVTHRWTGRAFIPRYKVPTRPSQHEKHLAKHRRLKTLSHTSFNIRGPTAPNQLSSLDLSLLILLSFPHPLRDHAIALFSRQQTTANIMTAQLLISLTGLITGIASAIQASADKHADRLEKRKQFTQETVRKLSDEGYNAVIVAGGFKALGYTQVIEYSFQGVDYTVFAAPQGQVMIVENRGDGGYENWALQGTNWVRWGKIVKFHTHDWNDATMGARFEVRAQNDFPGWFL